MEEIREESQQTPDTQPDAQPEQPAYVPRPTWQVWAARMGLVIFIIILILYYGVMFAGGGK